MKYEFYEILMLFAMYAILGWIFEQLLYGIHGKAVKRGLLKGPFSMLYGVSGVLMIFLLEPFNDSILYTFCAVFIAAIIFDLLALLVLKACSGLFMWEYSFIYVLIGTVLMIIAAKDVNPLLEKLVDIMPTWTQFAFLIIFYMWFISDFIDAADLMLKYRTEVRTLRAIRTDPIEYGQEACKFMSKYQRWIKGYPRFRMETIKRIFAGFTKEEQTQVKEAIRQYL